MSEYGESIGMKDYPSGATLQNQPQPQTGLPPYLSSQPTGTGTGGGARPPRSLEFGINYFKPRKSYKCFSIVLGIIGWLLIVVIVALSILLSNSNHQNNALQALKEPTITLSTTVTETSIVSSISTSISTAVSTTVSTKMVTKEVTIFVGFNPHTRPQLNVVSTMLGTETWWGAATSRGTALTRPDFQFFTSTVTWIQTAPVPVSTSV